MLVAIDDSELVAQPIPNGFSWTLPSRLGQMLAMAEQECGPRNAALTILGIEFKEGAPQIWFPGNRGHMVIQLSTSAMVDPIRALFQLAHECVHVLDGSTGSTNCLEEGFATDFALRFLSSQLRVNSFQTGGARYDTACGLVRQLLSLKGDVIRELRRLHGPLRNITAQQISVVCPGLPVAVAQQLAMAF